MQMGDQIDSKTLFGPDRCTEVAGQFVWEESTFAKWLQAPGVILLEDIDDANADVISKIVDIATNRQTDASNSEKNMDFHNEVRIIATMSGKGNKTAILDGVPDRIQVESLSDDELSILASKSYPRIAHLSRTLISTLRKIESVPGTGNSRQLTSTDFLRGCARLALLPDISANVETFAELIDTWCLADPRQRANQLCNIVASSLNVNSDRVNTHLSVRQPEVKYDEHVVSVGRSTLPRKSMIKTGKHRLGYTRDVVQLMERIAVCVSHSEPLLLVGETGVGKTSIVQAVADLIGVSLDVVNQKVAVLEAAEKGHWILVDEINLAPPECLDAIINALSAPGTHSNFRLFACMNPATDAGKRQLPPGVRTRFTEFFVSEPSDPFQLALIVSAYIPTVSRPIVENLVKFYLSAKHLYPSKYSLRTLCRALNFTADNMSGSVDQSVYEAVSMEFLTSLESEEKRVMRAKIQNAFQSKVEVMPDQKDDAASSAMATMIRFIHDRIVDCDEQQTINVERYLSARLNNIEKLEGFELMEKLQLVFIFSRPVSDEFVQMLRDAKYEIDLDNNKIIRFSNEDGSIVRIADSNKKKAQKKGRDQREQQGHDE
ncbi:unnamed protein product [Caenorhabditis nigoni]